MTTPSEATRRDRIEQELAAVAGKADVERINLPWQDDTELFPVIKLPLDHVLLNHRSHRIREQLDAHAQRQIVGESPHSDLAQGIIAEILRSTEGFAGLKANLDAYGQEEPGVATRVGVLVNANTRAVALRDLNQSFIRVAVLPKYVDPKDIARLELTLQMRKDFKQDYTFVNQLLFVEDLKNESGYTDEDVAQAMNLTTSPNKAELKKGARRAQQRTRLLALIREIQHRSENKIPLSFFNEMQSVFEELDREYEELKERDPKGADELKEARILAVLMPRENSLSFSYLNIRRLSAESARAYLVPNLLENEEFGKAVDALLVPVTTAEDLPGLGDLADEQLGRDGVTATLAPLVDLVAKSWDQEEVSLPSANGAIRLAREDFTRQISEAIGNTIFSVDQDKRATKSLTGPITFIRTARQHAEAARLAYLKVSTNRSFKAGALVYEIKKLMKVVEEFNKAIKKQRP